MQSTFSDLLETQQPPPIRPTLSTAERLELTWRHPKGMVGLSLINFVLRIVTLGVYNFWGKTEVRARLWSGVRINGEPISYLGTGRELFLGFLVAMLYVGIPYVVLLATQITAGTSSPIAGAVSLIFFTVFYWMSSVAQYRARRYRLTRTSWRGIRGDMAGSASRYAWTCLWTLPLVVLSLGWAYPWRDTKLQRILIENTRFGDAPLLFTASSDRLYGPFAVMWVGGFVGYFVVIMIIGGLAALSGLATAPKSPVPKLPPTMLILITLGSFAVYFLILWLASLWYRVRAFNHFAANTHFHGASFQGIATARGALWLGVSNALIGVLPFICLGGIGVGLAAALGWQAPQLVTSNQINPTVLRTTMIFALLSFGLFGPLVQARTARYWMSTLQLRGLAQLDTLLQAPRNRERQGEGLAQAFDIDVF